MRTILRHLRHYYLLLILLAVMAWSVGAEILKFVKGTP